MPDNASFIFLDGFTLLLVGTVVVSIYMLCGLWAIIEADNHVTTRGWPSWLPNDPLRGLLLWLLWLPVVLWWLTVVTFYETPSEFKRRHGRR